MTRIKKILQEIRVIEEQKYAAWLRCHASSFDSDIYRLTNEALKLLKND